MRTKKNKDLLPTTSGLRQLAEERLRADMTKSPPPATEEELQRLVHELEVHQIELEMQNVELRQARSEVETILEKYTDLYDLAPVGYMTLNRNGTISDMNLRGAGLLGIERSNLRGRRFEQFVKKEFRPDFTAFIDLVFASQDKEACELVLHNQENLPVIVQIVQIEASIDHSGQKCRLALIDITARRQAVDALREKEDQMFRLTEMSIDAIVMLNENGMITFCNAAVERMFGCSTDEIIGHDFHKILIPQRFIADAKMGFESFKKHGAGKLIGRTTEVVAMRTDGTEFPIELSVSALNIKGIWHAIAIMRDVTERKRAEVRISEVIRQQQAILDNIPNIAWLKDREGRYVAVNEPFSRAFDMAPNDLVGKNDYDIYPPELAKKYDKEFNDLNP